MKIKKSIICILAALMISTSFAGCSNNNKNNDNILDNSNPSSLSNTNNTNTPNVIPISVYPVQASPLVEPDYSSDNEKEKSIANGSNKFALDFSQKLFSTYKGENFVSSPYSAWLPLASLVNATDEQYKTELINILAGANITPDDLNNANSKMLYELTKTGNLELDENAHNTLQIANALFIKNGLSINKDFAQKYVDYFRGSAINVDFTSPEAVNAVNQWASDNTDGLIKEIITEFNPETQVAIANSVYFSDRWKAEFNPDDTKEGKFNSPSGEVDAKYMYKESVEDLYYEDESIQAISIPFSSGASMYIILPKEDTANNMFSKVDSEYFNKISSNMEIAKTQLTLPKFKIETDAMNLKDSLSSMGISLFDSSKSPINGLVNDESLFISEAVQKAVIEVDEKGTTAAAVTIMGMTKSALIEPDKTATITCDKPFIFILSDNTFAGEQILFTGVVNNPNA